jgi:parallel beta-helix repeat protein
MRNNVIVNCSDVGIHVNKSKNTRLLHSTLIGTSRTAEGAPFSRSFRSGISVSR